MKLAFDLLCAWVFAITVVAGGVVLAFVLLERWGW